MAVSLYGSTGTGRHMRTSGLAGGLCSTKGDNAIKIGNGTPDLMLLVSPLRQDVWDDGEPVDGDDDGRRRTSCCAGQRLCTPPPALAVFTTL